MAEREPWSWRSTHRATTVSDAPWLILRPSAGNSCTLTRAPGGSEEASPECSQTERSRRRGGRGSLPEREEPELAELKATCHRQTLVIDKLSDAISALRSDVTTLERENSDLREENARVPVQLPGSTPGDDEMVEAVLHLDVQAPAAARALAADFLRDRVTPRLVDIAQLIMSELVSNSLRHNAAPHGQAVVVRVALERGTWRLEVEDPEEEASSPPTRSEPPPAASG